MRDIITYSPDVTKLLTEVETKLPEYIIKDNENNSVGFNVTKTPTVRKGNETLAVLRCSSDDVKLLKTLTNIIVLVDVPAYDDLLSAMTPENRAIYDGVYSQTPYEITLQDGSKQTITPPELIGRFA